MNETIEDRVAQQDITITVSDARSYFGGCIHGWQGFAEAHDLEWKAVVRHGLLASQLLATKDAMATSLVTYVYDREEL